ncbi:MAG: leucine-rich repeat protein, partial [Proteobacteria bacterium]|nr:leucine-rich repeat protein [Pseudomonadota bacterium]
MRKVMLVALFSSLVVSCNESSQYDGSKRGDGHGLAQSQSSLTCLSFTDSAIEAYAKSNWDGNNDGCVSKEEAAAVTSIPANAFAGNTSITSLDDLKQLPNLTSIGDNAFAGCTNLKNANLSTVTS